MFKRRDWLHIKGGDGGGGGSDSDSDDRSDEELRHDGERAFCFDWNCVKTRR